MAHDGARAIDLDASLKLLAAAKERPKFEHAATAASCFQYEPSPVMVAQGIAPLVLGRFQTEDTIETTLFDFGVASTIFTVPFTGTLDELIELAALAIADQPSRNLIENRAREAAENLFQAIAPAVKQSKLAKRYESYAIFVLDKPETAAADDSISSFVDNHDAKLAQVLAGQKAPLAAQWVNAELNDPIGFLAEDAFLISGSAAILFGPNADNALEVLELVNVQLLELGILAERLNEQLGSLHRQLDDQDGVRALPGSIGRNLELVAWLRADAALQISEVADALEVIGDYALTWVHERASERRGCNELLADIERNIHALEAIQTALTNETARRSSHRYELIMILLEFIIVVLIMAELLK